MFLSFQENEGKLPFLKSKIKNKIKAVDYTYIFFRFFRTLSTASWCVMPILWPFQEENDLFTFILFLFIFVFL